MAEKILIQRERLSPRQVDFSNKLVGAICAAEKYNFLANALQRLKAHYPAIFIELRDTINRI